MLDAHQIHGQIGPEIGGEARTQVPHEIVMQKVDRAKLRFRDAIQTPEVEAHALVDDLLSALALFQILKNSVDFLLR